MNGCEECIIYMIQHNMCESDECPGCGKQTLIWKLDKYGTPHLECTKCAYVIAVDLNTPCELDPLFDNKVSIVIGPQAKLPSKDIIVEMAKYFEMNAIQMRRKLLEGYSTEVGLERFTTIVSFLQKNQISYKVEDYEDLRLKYPFFTECGYPYSRMRIFS